MAGQPDFANVNSPAFFSEELDRAFLECGYALQAWSRLDARPGLVEARASIELSDEDAPPELVVVIDERGYWAEPDSKKLWPTLDDLLAAHSTFFRKRRQTLLTRKLEDVAAERSWPDNQPPVDNV